MNNIAILILAAGSSSRMKTPKQILKINNKFLLEIVIEKALTIQKDNIFCVLGEKSDEIKQKISFKNTQIIINTQFKNGLSSSIISGIKHITNNNLNCKGVLILLADQPAIETNYLKALYQLFKANNSKIVASQYVHNFGVPAIFPKKYFSQLLFIKGDKGAKEFINTKKNDVICPKFDTNFIDIDTKEDFIQYKKSTLNKL